MKTKHTSGPWHFAEPFNLCHTPERGLVRVRGIGNGACHVGYASITPANGGSEALANARLIVKAPDMAELIQGLVNDAHDVLNNDGDLDYETMCRAILNEGKRFGFRPERKSMRAVTDAPKTWRDEPIRPQVVTLFEK